MTRLATVLLLVAGPHSACGARDDSDESYPDVEWSGTYEKACSTACGQGITLLKDMICVSVKTNYDNIMDKMKKGIPKEVPNQLCATAEVKLPAQTKPCEEFRGCEWRVGTAPSDNCGWSDTTCAPASGSPDESLVKFCDMAERDGLIENRSFFQSKNGLVTVGCVSTLDSICTITINQPPNNGMFTSIGTNLKASKTKVAEAMHKCEDPDVIVIASQEMKNVAGDIFSPLSDHLATGDWAEVGRCGARISAGVQVLVKAVKRMYFAPLTLRCWYDENSYGGKGAWTNTKGTAFLKLNTVKGILVAASTHGQRGGVLSKPRRDQLLAAAQQIVEANPQIVAWGGDFNTRTNISADTELGQEILQFGSSHPEDIPVSDTEYFHDANSNWSQDPAAVLRALQQTPDKFGSEDGKSLQELLTDATHGKLREVEGVRDLCPTYRKAPDSGKFKKTGMFLARDGSTKKKMWGIAKDGKTINEWKPYVACKAVGYPVEYFLSPLVGKTKWPDRAPSWTERIIVTNRSKCSRPKKVISAEDHDVLLARCSL